MTFHELPDHARLWVHTADRDLTAGGQEAVLEALSGFLDGWAAHGAALTAAGCILYDRVLVVGLDGMTPYGTETMHLLRAETRRQSEVLPTLQASARRTV